MGNGRTTSGRDGLLRVLLVEDVEDDALLIVRVLRRAGFAVEWLRVATRVDLARALAGQSWDVVTCDWVMPDLDPRSAIELIRTEAPGLPLIAVSGERRDEVVIGALRAGARHFVGKDHLVLLAPIVEAVLCEGDRRGACRRETPLMLVAQRR
ncbi:MAG: response regulator [Candidatus Binatia bacterium]